MWLRRIRALCEELDQKDGLDQIIRVEESIKLNKFNIRKLKIENMKENAIGLTLQIKLINRAKNKEKTKNMTKNEKKLA